MYTSTLWNKVRFILFFFSQYEGAVVVSNFLWALQFPPPIKLTTTIKLKYC